MNWYRKILTGIMKVEIVFGAFLVILIVVVMCWQVFQRYILGNPLIWAQELTMLCFIWATMIGASVALMTSEHIIIESFMRFLPERLRKIILACTSVVIIAGLIFLLRYLPRSIEIQNRSYTSSLPINIPRGYFYTVPVLISAVMMILTQIYYVIYQVMDLLGIQIPEEIYIGQKDNISFEEQI